MINFIGKTAYITGASGGIAASCAKKMYQLGANLVLTDIQLPTLTAWVSAENWDESRLLLLQQDVSNSSEADAVVAKAVAKFGGLDIVIPCAGLYKEQAIRQMSDAEWSKVLGVNLDGVFFTIRAAIPHLSMGASIVNVTSMAGHKGSFQHGHYAAAKGAVLTLTRTLASELAPNVRVNNVSPGLIDTPMIQGLMAEKGDTLLAATPLARLGNADEVADAILYLASDSASFITGETLHVNGGLYIHS